jgi:N-methylhydantoinase B
VFLDAPSPSDGTSNGKVTSSDEATGERSTLLGFVANQAHHVDVGGFAPGSMPFGVSEVYQEGLQIPPLKLARRGEIDEQIIALIAQNVRTPRESRGDLKAQIAATYIGQRRLADLVTKYGHDTVLFYLAEMMNYAERRMRARLRDIPSGVYEYSDVIEGDGIEDRLVRIAVRITVDDDRFVADFSATDDQVRGPLNCRWPSVAACVYYVLKGLLDPDLPANAGAYRPIEIITRSGSVLGAQYPAAVCNANIITTQRIVDVLLGALLPALPERVCAACSGTMNLLNIGGLHPETGEYYNYIETYAGGQGATFDRDGSDAVQNHMTNTRNAPVEVIEATYPFQIIRYALVPDSEGAGRYRGGVGVVREFELLGDYVKLTLSSDRQQVHPWGVQGGQAAAGSHCIVVHPSGDTEALKSKFTTTVRQGDRVITITPGGGGWGEPTERDPEQLAWDVTEGVISPERAQQVYGRSTG